MPPLLAAALVAAIPALEGATIAGVAAANVIAYGITTIATIGAQFAFNRLAAAKRQKGDPQLTSFTIKQPIPVRQRGYGTCKLAGALFYEDAIPLQFQDLLIGVVFCEGPVDRIVSYYLNEAQTNLSGTGGQNLALPWIGNIFIEGKTGESNQTVSSTLAVRRGFSTQRLFGLCYAVMDCNQMPRPDKYFQFYYPNGVPTLRAVINLSKVYDPRDGGQSWTNASSWKFSKNPALIIMDYLTYGLMDSTGRFISRGMGLPKSRINIASFVDFANLCDEIVASAYTVNPVDGSVTNTPRNEARYECNGLYQMDEQPTDVLNKLLATCDGTLYTLADGSVGIRGGKWEAPTVIINDDMILSCELSQDTGKLEKFNHLKISFSATNLDYQIVEGVPWEDFEDEDDNGVLTEELSLPYVQSHSQARRLAKIATAKGNPEWHYTSLICTFAVMNTLGEEFVHVIHTMPGIDQDFLVLGHKISIENKTVELQLASIDSAAYAWNAAFDDAPPPSPQGQGTSIGYDPGAITGGGGGETPADRVAAAAQSLAPVGQVAALAVGFGGTRLATTTQTLGALGQSAEAFGPGFTRTADVAQTLGAMSQDAHAIHGTPTIWDDSYRNSNITLSGGDLTATLVSPGKGGALGAIVRGTNAGIDGRYFEFIFSAVSTHGDLAQVGLVNADAAVTDYLGYATSGTYPINSLGLNSEGGLTGPEGTPPWGGITGSAPGFDIGDVMGVQLLSSTAKIFKNGTLAWTFSDLPSGIIYPAVCLANVDDAGTANFGGAPMFYLPSGATPWDG